MAYKMKWFPGNLSVLVEQCVDPNKFGVRNTPWTAEEKAIYNAELKKLTQVEKITRLFDESFAASWIVTELGQWCAANIPNTQARRFALGKDARLMFDSLDDAMLFKLTWA
jgi:hypothetical protein